MQINRWILGLLPTCHFAKLSAHTDGLLELQALSMKLQAVLSAAILLLVAYSPASARQLTAPMAQAIRHGHKLVLIGGCNDCHTPGWTTHAGHAPKAVLLTGDGVVWHGPWGTTYPPNLRLWVHSMTVNQWIHTVRNTKALPPMPWWAFRAMSNRDLRDIYAYIYALGPAGHPTPAALPPGKLPRAPYMNLVLPKHPKS